MSQYALSGPQAMALSQLYTNSIHNADLLAALAEIPREWFVPKHLAEVAYVDEALYLGEHRYLPAPLDGARLLQFAGLHAASRLLVVACGSGYLSAVAARLAAEVVAVESSPRFIQKLDEYAATLGITNLTTAVVDQVLQGYPEASPYDAIIVPAAVHALPQALITQLADGGRLVYAQAADSPRPGGACGLGHFTMITKQGDALHTQTLGECFLPALDVAAKPTTFAFG